MKVSRQHLIQSKELVITEKPSVASDLAKALGGFTKRGDHYESDTHLIAAAAGHLLDSVRPKTWALEDLPLLPEEVQKKPKPRQAPVSRSLTALKRTPSPTLVNRASSSLASKVCGRLPMYRRMLMKEEKRSVGV